MRNISKRPIIWFVIAALILLIFLASWFTNDVQPNEVTAYCLILLVFGGAFELWQWLKTQNRIYRYAFGIWLAGLILIGWVNGAVGIIGSENNPANLMYGAVVVVGLIGSLIARFKPRGMALTLLISALVQISIPFVALFIWPARVSWGEAGVIGVIIFNAILAAPFILSALLFWRVVNK